MTFKVGGERSLVENKCYDGKQSNRWKEEG